MIFHRNDTQKGNAISFLELCQGMPRDKLGGVPYELKKEGGKLSIRFFPKSPDAKNPDGIVFVLQLDTEDKKKLSEIIN